MSCNLLMLMAYLYDQVISEVVEKAGENISFALRHKINRVNCDIVVVRIPFELVIIVPVM